MRRENGPSLDDFNYDRRWVSWKEEMRDGKKVKIPKSANGHNASTSDPGTWSTRARAERLNSGRIGYVLGNIGLGLCICGIDLDGCLDSSGVINGVPREVIDRFSTYSEVSPSGTGVKLFFQAGAADVKAIQDEFDINTRRTFSSGSHREIALDFKRYYAVTGKQLGPRRTLRYVSRDDLRWLITDAGPRFIGHTAKSVGRDESGSGYGYRFFGERRVKGDDREQAFAAIRADQGRAGEWARRVDERQLVRAWEKSSDWKKTYEKEQFPQPSSLADLKHQYFPPLRWIVPGIVPEGLTLLCGRPKIGKSWMALRIALGVAILGNIFGQRLVKGGDLLLCDLESGQRRLKNRARKYLGQGEWPKALKYTIKMPKLDKGAVDYLMAWTNEAKDPRLIVIDTLTSIKTSRGRNDTQYQFDYDQVSRLQKFATDRHIAIILIYHTRKADALDPLDLVNATQGLSGAVDTVMVIYKDKETRRIILHIEGRDLEEVFDFVIAFERDTAQWEIVGDVEEENYSENEKWLRTLLKETNDCELIRQRAETSSIPWRTVQHVSRRLNVISRTIGFGKHKKTTWSL